MLSLLFLVDSPNHGERHMRVAAVQLRFDCPAHPLELRPKAVRITSNLH
jgi:hypothetical protein